MLRDLATGNRTVPPAPDDRSTGLLWARRRVDDSVSVVSNSSRSDTDSEAAKVHTRVATKGEFGGKIINMTRMSDPLAIWNVIIEESQETCICILQLHALRAILSRTLPILSLSLADSHFFLKCQP